MWVVVFLLFALVGCGVFCCFLWFEVFVLVWVWFFFEASISLFSLIRKRKLDVTKLREFHLTYCCVLCLILT